MADFFRSIFGCLAVTLFQRWKGNCRGLDLSHYTLVNKHSNN